MAKSAKKSTEVAPEYGAPVEVSKKKETMYRVGEHNTFKDKIYAEKYAAKKGLVVKEVKV